MKVEILEEAKNIVCGEREKEYGETIRNFTHISNMWTAYLRHPITAIDVANMMILLKVARLKSSPSHKDSWVDVAGYAACGAECSDNEYGTC